MIGYYNGKYFGEGAKELNKPRRFIKPCTRDDGIYTADVYKAYLNKTLAKDHPAVKEFHDWGIQNEAHRYWLIKHWYHPAYMPNPSDHDALPDNLSNRSWGILFNRAGIRSMEELDSFLYYFDSLTHIRTCGAKSEKEILDLYYAWLKEKGRENEIPNAENEAKEDVKPRIIFNGVEFTSHAKLCEALKAMYIGAETGSYDICLTGSYVEKGAT